MSPTFHLLGVNIQIQKTSLQEKEARPLVIQTLHVLKLQRNILDKNYSTLLTLSISIVVMEFLCDIHHLKETYRLP